MNSHIGHIVILHDFVENDDINIYVDVLPDDYQPDRPMPRKSQDTVTNQNGNLLLDFCKESGFKILNGRVGQDGKLGKYTYVSTTGCSVVDYVLASVSILNLFNNFEVQDPNILSDHCVVKFTITTTSVRPNTENQGHSSENIDFVYKWKTEKYEQFQNRINDEETIHKLNTLINELDNIDTNNDIDASLNNFQSVMDDVCSPLFKYTYPNNIGSDTPNVDVNKPWFDDSCRVSREQFLIDLNNFRKNKSDINRANMCSSRSTYKHILRNKRYEHRVQNTSKLLEARASNAKDYWKLLKRLNNNKCTNSVSANEFARYFKSINDPDSVFLSS